MVPRAAMMPQGAMAAEPGRMAQPGMLPQPAMTQGGHLYTQTNEIRNCVIHYFRAPDGKLTEMERVFTAGAGSGTFKPVSGQENAPNAFEGANSVILTPDRRFLFATNGGDNPVSRFPGNAHGNPGPPSPPRPPTCVPRPH